jgi:hypothetical protein
MDDISEAKARFESMLEANQLEWNIAIGIFVIGLLVFAYLVKNENQFNFKETLLAIAGLKRYSRTWTINIVHILTIIIPVLITVYAFKN